MIKKLSWKKEYQIGVYEIVVEHRIFLRIIKKIGKAFNENLPNEYIKLLLEELYKYADFHFTSEENEMIKYGYPEYELHKTQHNELIQTLANTINFYDIEKVDRKELMDFLFYWFKEHTTTIDLKLGVFLKSLS